MPSNDGSVDKVLAGLLADGALTRFIRSEVSNPDAVLDVRQEVCLRFLVLWPKVTEPIESPIAFAIGIAKNVIKEHRRSGKRARREESDEALHGLPHEGAGPDDLANTARRKILVREALIDLKPLDRAIFLMVHRWGLTDAEAGRQLNRSDDQVLRIRRRVSRLIQAFITSREGSDR